MKFAGTGNDVLSLPSSVGVPAEMPARLDLMDDRQGLDRVVSDSLNF
jgi:hypothetical protein